MTIATNTAQILKKIGSAPLNLFRGRGYWYFVYDDVETGIYETSSVYTMYLKDMSVEQWVEEGLQLVNSIKA